MLQGIEYLRSARRHLAHEDIEQAAEDLWKAMFYLDEWPAALQRRANALLPLMFRAGPIAVSIRQLDPAERETLGHELVAFLDEARRSDGVACPWDPPYVPAPACWPEEVHVGAWTI